MKILFALLAVLTSYTSLAQDSTSNLNSLFEEIESYNDSVDPQDSLYAGQHISGTFSSPNEQYYQRKRKTYKQFIIRLADFPDNQLSRQEAISKELMRYKLQNTLDDIRFEMYLIPLSAEGGFYDRISWALSRLPFAQADDYEAYLRWLPHYSKWMEDHLALMQEGIKKGVVAPKTVILNNIALLKQWLPDSLEKSVFYKPFLNIPQSMTVDETESLQKRATQVLQQSILPSYRKLNDFLKTDYLDAAPEKPGIRYLPGGKAYYENRVAYYTTLDISPDSVHALGLQEVARIKALMIDVIEELDFEGTFEDFYQFLRTDEQFYPKTPQELLNRAAWISKKAEEQLPKYFKELYSLPFTVNPVPAAIAPTYTAGRYSGGSMESGKAGEYWVNTYKLESRTLYTLPALTLHEAVPGHHLQNALAQEIEDIPSFRNRFYTSAFGEGWGLYSEFLGEEMGIYNTLYEKFGRYTYEMWRACRLVVDTGIHYKGWTRKEALDFMQSNTALSIHEVTTEIDRYIGWPGQALSYKVGEIKIKSLRQKAEEELGEKFDIREFHFHLLKNGAVTLPILEEEINRYIAEKLAD